MSNLILRLIFSFMCLPLFATLSYADSICLDNTKMFEFQKKIAMKLKKQNYHLSYEVEEDEKLIDSKINKYVYVKNVKEFEIKVSLIFSGTSNTKKLALSPLLILFVHNDVKDGRLPPRLLRESEENVLGSIYNSVVLQYPRSELRCEVLSRPQ